MEVQIQRFSIGNIVNYKTPFNNNCWGKIVEILRVEDSILIKEKGNIVYKIEPFNVALNLDTVNQEDIKEAYSIFYNENKNWEE